MVTCPNGHENPDESRFCNSCGSPIASASATGAPPPPASGPPPPPSPAPVTAPPGTPPPFWKRPAGIIVLALAGLLLLGGIVVALGGEPEERAVSPTDAPAPSPTAEESPADDPVEPTPADEFEFTELNFGERLPVVTDDGSEETMVAVLKPILARCQYPSIGCTKPETGDRVIQVEIEIENTGSTVATWGSDYFVLEFADGTQVTTSDGNAYEYGPSNVMDYEVKVRPGSTFRSTLVFEAPNGPFSILILTNAFDGTPFASWS